MLYSYMHIFICNGNDDAVQLNRPFGCILVVVHTHTHTLSIHRGKIKPIESLISLKMVFFFRLCVGITIEVISDRKPTEIACKWDFT